ncbi:exo-alpha-sialidase [Caviibacterium pharyngocola]|uniref:exo-alpha-sialidase n=1 Tax=Caviibacterium pharyngocola TaxID=28159 RepID=A0A2M8RUY1_9PAST|nr:exo-alpha-sialidase [Caviibacterium pharyngocola]PJG82700.1 hypothetical protein CVP04_07815 [Caviibacterium pharyngocola]
MKKTKKTNLLRKTALSLLISSAVLSGAYASTAILDFSSVESFQPVDMTEHFTSNNVFSLSSGTLTFRVNPNSGFSTLLGVSDNTADDRYIMFYTNVTAAGQTYGIEIRDRTNLIPNSQLVTQALPASSDGFRTVTYSFDKENQTIKIYVDGQLRQTSTQSKFFEDISGLNTASLGSLKRPNNRTNTFTGAIYHAGATDEVLSDSAILKLHEDIVARHSVDLAKQAEKLAYLSEKRERMGAFMSEKYEMFKPGQGGAASYRIPGLLATQEGVVIAAIDKRNQHASDWGNIDLAIRRSLDGGVTWQDDQVVVDLAEQTYSSLGAAESALVIDAVMVQDKQNGRISMVFDMFPESQALFGMFSNSQASFESEGNGHIQVDGKWYRLITDESGARYTVREEGIVYNRMGEAQDYRVVIEGDPNRSFKDLGDIIQISTGERVGNIFLRSRKSGHDSGPFNAHYTSYLWMTYSEDQGATWASPIDITTQVKADWMRFLGTGPGTGIQLKNGNLVVPVYFTNRDNKQSSAVIISKDGGKTWERGDSPNDAYLDEIGGARYLNTYDYEITESQVVEMDNGDIKMFSRNRSGAVIISTSHDGGMTWDKGARLREAALLDPYSQMSVIHYSKRIDGKEYLVFANPHATGSRSNGMAWLGEVQEDGSIQWKYNTTIDAGTYSYNSLTELPNGDIGLLYEQVQGQNVQYVRFNLQELFWKDNIIYRDKRNTSNPNVSLNSIESVEEETFYKIGDGEMVKVGSGVNNAKLVVKEGIATLNQTANDQGEKQAYREITVKENGLVRLGDAEQINFSNLILEQGTLDLYGNDITLDNQGENSGLRAEIVNGNIINTQGDVTLTYRLDDNHTIKGNLAQVGDNSALNLIYSPTNADSALRLEGNTALNALDVKTGTLTYTPNTFNLAEKATVRTNANLVIEDAVLSVGSVSLENNSNLIAEVSEGKTAALYADQIDGEGNLIKRGAGVLTLSGQLDHSGNTELQAGNIHLDDATFSASTLRLAADTALTGSGEVNGKTVWQNGSLIVPGYYSSNTGSQTRSASGGFTAQRLVFNDVENQGGTVALRVNNNVADITRWGHDEIVIKGNLTTESAVPVSIKLAGTQQGKSDTNGDGQYDAEEGLSLIKVYGDGTVSQFALSEAIDSLNSPYDLTLVSFDKGVAGDYYDYQLHNTLITESGALVTPVVYKKSTETPVEDEPTTEPETPTTDNGTTAEAETPVTDNGTTTEAETPATDNATAVELETPATDNSTTAEPETPTTDNATTVKPETPTTDNGTTAETETPATDNGTTADTETPVTDNSTTAEAETPTTDNATTAEAETPATDNGTTAEAETPATDNGTTAEAETPATDNGTTAEAETPATDNATTAEAETPATDNSLVEEKPTTTVEEKPATNNATNNAATSPARTKLNDHVPSYLVAGTAMVNQGNTVRDMFTDNLWAKHKKGFYVIQKHSNADYTTDLSFVNYGYNYDSKQNTTLFGGYVPVSANTELHAGLGFSNQKVTPKAVDGYSYARYKTTSLLLAVHNEWDNLLLNTHVGLHWHRGKVSTHEVSDIARIKGNQYQIGSELGYKFNLGQFSVTPVAGLSYQYFDMDVTDKSRYQLNVTAEPYRVFTQYAGSYVGWDNEIVALRVGALYEHNNESRDQLVINNEGFTTGRLGNSVVLKANADFSILPQLKLGVQFEHRHAVSDAKLKQTDIAAKLEYKF